jgi:hypothetical protein
LFNVSWGLARFGNRLISGLFKKNTF